MSLSAIRTQIKTILEGVSGIGSVYDYERWSRDWQGFLDLFKDSNDLINGWMFSRTATPAEVDTRDSFERAHRIRFRGVYGLNDADATEKTFQDLVEAIVTAFNADTELGSSAFKSGPIQVKTVEHRLFGSVLCHYAELELDVYDTATFS